MLESAFPTLYAWGSLLTGPQKTRHFGDILAPGAEVSAGKLAVAFQLPSTLSLLLGKPENVDSKRYTHHASNNQRPSATPYIRRPNGPILQEGTSQPAQHIGSR